MQSQPTVQAYVSPKLPTHQCKLLKFWSFKFIQFGIRLTQPKFVVEEAKRVSEMSDSSVWTLDGHSQPENLFLVQPGVSGSDRPCRKPRCVQCSLDFLSIPDHCPQTPRIAFFLCNHKSSLPHPIVKTLESKFLSRVFVAPSQWPKAPPHLPMQPSFPPSRHPLIWIFKKITCL